MRWTNLSRATRRSIVPHDGEYSVEIAILTVLGFVIGTTYYFVRARLRQKFILAKIERRRSKRSSEESLLGTKKSKRSTGGAASSNTNKENERIHLNRKTSKSPCL